MNNFKYYFSFNTGRNRQQWKTLILSTNLDQNKIETEFLIAICRPTCDKWKSKTLFLSIFDLRSFIIKTQFLSVLDCRLSGVIKPISKRAGHTAQVGLHLTYLHMTKTGFSHGMAHLLDRCIIKPPLYPTL